MKLHNPGGKDHFPQLCRRRLGNTVVGETAEKALGRGRPAVGVECGVLVLHPEQPGLAPTFQGMEGTGCSSDALVIEHQLYTGEQNRLCGSRGCSFAGTPRSSKCPGGSSGSWLPHSRAGDLWVVSFCLLPPPLPHAYSLISWDGAPKGDPSNLSAQVRNEVSATSQSGCSERGSDWLSSSLVGLEMEMATHSSILA